MFYLTTHSTHFIYGYLASGIWLRTILIAREETRCRHMGYSFRLAARVLLYAPSHRQDSTYHGLCYTSRGALAGTPKIKCVTGKLALKKHQNAVVWHVHVNIHTYVHAYIHTYIHTCLGGRMVSVAD